MIKVTQVLYSGLGGHGSVAFSLQSAIPINKLSFSFIFFGVESTRSEYSEYCLRNRLKFFSIKKKVGFDYNAYVKFFLYLRKLNPDIILLHSVSLLIPTFFYCFVFRKKIIVIEHQTNSHKRKSEWLWTLLSHFLAHQIVYLTDVYKEQVKKKIFPFYDQYKVNIINNGLDEVFFGKTKAVEQNIFSMISRFTSLRDHKTLVDAFEKIINEANRSQFYLYLAGDGETFEEIRNYVRQKGLQDKVIFPGLLNEEQVINLLRTTFIYVHSSLGETMSTSIMQAMAAKKPVIATNIDGINNMVIDNANGLLFEAKNKDDLCAQIQKLIENVDIRIRISENAYKYARSKFSNQTMGDKYFEVIKKVLKV